MREASPAVPTLKIMNQFRSKNGFVYDLRCQDARLTLAIAPRENEQDQGDWKVEARASHAPEALAITAWGATRVEALREVGRSWVEQTGSGLPTFDWEAVVKALTEVRAV